MAEYYVHDGQYLIAFGTAPDGMEEAQAGEGQFAVLGHPPGFTVGAAPPVGHRWHLKRACWVDVREAAEQHADRLRLVAAQRHAAYPSAADLGDALYWQSKGDNSKMEAYLAACEAVKARYPKPRVE